MKKECKQLVKWHLEEFSALPWRKKRSVYSTLVSEIMLQQTTVPTVLKKFNGFIKKYPNISKLSKATEEEIEIEWKGLGYYRRARNLLKGAKYLEKDKFIPNTFEELLNIPGVGDYTASAILAIGKDELEICIDANLERVLSRIYLIDIAKGPKLKKELKELFDKNKLLKDLQDYGGRIYNESLMDLGREICVANNPKCNICFFKNKCKAYKQDLIESFPVVLKKKTKKYNLKLLRIISKKGDKLAVVKREKGSWLQGQFEIPTFILESEDPSLIQYPRLNKLNDFKIKKSYKTLITKYKIENIVIELNERDLKKFIKGSGQDIFEYICLKKDQNISTATIKAIA